MELRNCRQVESYLKKRCPKYDAGLIEVGKRGTSSQYDVLVVVNGRLHRMQFYSHSEGFDLLVPKLNELFETGKFDMAKYYVVTDGYFDRNTSRCVNTPAPLELEGKVFRFDPADSMMHWLTELRKKYPSIGANEVPKQEQWHYPYEVL